MRKRKFELNQRIVLAREYRVLGGSPLPVTDTAHQLPIGTTGKVVGDDRDSGRLKTLQVIWDTTLFSERILLVHESCVEPEVTDEDVQHVIDSIAQAWKTRKGK